MSERIKKGDVVSMKSGSCKMVVVTINDFEAGTFANVNWQNYDTKQIMSHLIDIECLQKEV